MALRETITVSITPELRAFIRERLATGRYGGTSEVVRAGLRALERFEAPTDSMSTGPKVHNPLR